MQIELSDDEAIFLLDLLRKVGGCPTTSRRRHADSILKQLHRTKLEASYRNDMVLSRGGDAIYMRDRDGNYPGWERDSLRQAAGPTVLTGD